MAQVHDGGNDEGSIGLLSSPDIRTGFIRQIDTQEYKPVVYSVIDGQAVFEGCIILGSVSDMEKLATNLRNQPSGSDFEHLGVVISGQRYRWPQATVPFQIAPGLPNTARVTKAIQHWEAKTKLRFPPRKPSDQNFITFRPSEGCSSSVGMRGGEQFINLGPACTVGNTIHEIGHAVGLWHEQSREDRDRFIKINFQNIDPNAIHNFNQHITDGDDVGQYDFGSIMHYPKDAFSKNGKPTIEPVGGQSIGQRTGLSPRDIATVTMIYP